jgi:indolepyruvate ferredoxin oxidoreductase
MGESPGLDRAADVIRHGNLSGTTPLGGAVAWIGDDPSSKSSSVPSSCEPMCRSRLTPVLTPGSVQELLEFGLHAVAMSCHAGLWTALKIVADIADASTVVDVGAALDAVPGPPLRQAPKRPVLLPPTNLDAEHDLMTDRLAREYVRLARRAVGDLGLDEQGLGLAGVRLVQLGVPWPLAPAEVRELIAGVETVLVVEDKLPFLEPMIGDALYRQPGAPLVLGKADAEGRPLLSARSALVADEHTGRAGRRAGDRGCVDSDPRAMPLAYISLQALNIAGQAVGRTALRWQ